MPFIQFPIHKLKHNQRKEPISKEGSSFKTLTHSVEKKVDYYVIFANRTTLIFEDTQLKVASLIRVESSQHENND